MPWVKEKRVHVRTQASHICQEGKRYDFGRKTPACYKKDKITERLTSRVNENRSPFSTLIESFLKAHPPSLRSCVQTMGDLF